MFGRKKQQISNERLDLIGRCIVRASTSNEEEVEKAASSPFLYTRVRARIRAEQERREASERWLAMLTVFRRAVPAMGLAALIAFLSFWFAVSQTSSMSYSVESFFGTDEAEFERVAITERNSLTQDEVLSAILNDEREETR